MELKNNELSSGSQTLGINARPVPQVRLALSDYWTLPFANGWLHLKGHIAYGMMTDQNWQHNFTAKQSKYTDRALFHSKAGYLKVGNDEVFCPWSLEMGLKMVSILQNAVNSNKDIQWRLIKFCNEFLFSLFYDELCIFEYVQNGFIEVG